MHVGAPTVPSGIRGLAPFGPGAINLHALLSIPLIGFPGLLTPEQKKFYISEAEF